MSNTPDNAILVAAVTALLAALTGGVGFSLGKAYDTAAQQAEVAAVAKRQNARETMLNQTDSILAARIQHLYQRERHVSAAETQRNSEARVHTLSHEWNQAYGGVDLALYPCDDAGRLQYRKAVTALDYLRVQAVEAGDTGLVADFIDPRKRKRLQVESCY